MEKRQFFRVAKAGLGKYCTGGYGQIALYRVNPFRIETCDYGAFANASDN